MGTLSAIGTAMLLCLVPGCINAPSVTPSNPESTDDAAGPRFFAFNVVVDDEAYALEPSLAVTPDGTLFTYANGDSALTTPGVLNWRVATIFRSQDGGHEWEAVGTPLELQPDADPHMTADRDGTLWFDQMSVGTAGVAVSQDEGATWWSDAGASRGPVYDRPYVVPTEGGTAFLFYLASPDQTVAWKTLDHGRTWLPAGPVHPSPLVASGWSGGGFWNPATGSVFLTVPVKEPGVPLQAVPSTVAPGFAVTRDGGLTFEIGSVPSAAWPKGALLDALVDGTADRAGNVYLTWAAEVEGVWHVFVAGSTDDGGTWPLVRAFSTGNGTRVFPTVTAADDGEVAVAFYETATSGQPETLPEDAHWNVTVAYTADFFGDGAIQHGRLSREPVHRGPVCISGNGCQEFRQLGDFFDLDTLPDDRLGAVWTMSRPDAAVGVVVYGATGDVFP